MPHIDYFKAPLVGISEFPAIILAIHCISCQFPSKKDFLAFFLAQYFLLPGNFLASGSFGHNVTLGI
jgi:hypothetical protein